MNVSDALVARRSVRAFLDTPLEPGIVARLANQAARAPSGGNLQPWRIWHLPGASMHRFRRQMSTRLDQGQSDTPEYPVYPPDLHPPYRDHRFAVGEAMYARLGIERSNKAERLNWFAENYRFFGAPDALFVFVDRRMRPPQWSDLGMFLQSFMLLCTEQGIATCAQEAWALHHAFVSEFCDVPSDLMLFCGCAIGYEDKDHRVNRLQTDRAPLDDWFTTL
ncbi:MAG: nitroreductase [Pseudomonadota bacterium]